MIILFYGKDTYRLKEKLNEIVEEYKKKHKSGFNLKFLDAKEINLDDLKSDFLSISMFKEKKLFVLSNVFSNAKIKEDFEKKAHSFFESSNILVLVEEGDISSKDKLFCLLKEKAKIEVFNLLRVDQVKKWIKERLKGKEIELTAMDKLVEFVGSDLWKMSKEIEKLINYSSKTIKEKDVELLVSPVFDSNIFETIDAIARKEKKKAVELISHHLKKGDSAPYIFSMIAFQFRNIISVKGVENPNSLGLNPFVLRKSISQAKNFSIEKLKEIYSKIVYLDTDIKTGRISPETALDFLIFDV